MTMSVRCLSFIALLAVGLLSPSKVHADPKPVRISPDDPSSIGAAIQRAVETKQKKLVIPPGIYEIPGSQPRVPRAFHLRVNGAKDLEIDATGATLVFADRQQQSLAFFNCSNVTLRGATLRRKTSSISQGVVTAVADDGKSIVVQIDKGYPTDIDDRSVFPTFMAKVYSEDRAQWLAHYRGGWPPVVEKLGQDRFRVSMAQDLRDAGVEMRPGLTLVWRGEVFDDLAVRNCQDMKFIDVTVESGSGMCFHEMGGGGGNLYRGCKSIYGAPPPGANQKPLLASSADTFHSSDMRRGPIIENCLFEGADDDAIAIHGFYACAVESKDHKLIIWRVANSMNPFYATPGDQLRFYDDRGVYHSVARVVSSREVLDYAVPEGYKPHPKYRLFSDLKTAKFVELTLDQKIDSKPNWLVANVDECGSGYIVRNTIIRNGVARGIIAKADNGLIEGCTIENMARAGIELMPEFLSFPESDYSQNVIVRNNVIRHVSLNRGDGFFRHPGSIAIYGYGSEGGYIQTGGNRNILIEGNTFEDNNGPNLLIASSDTVTIRNNRFVRPMKIPSTFGQSKGVNPKALAFVTQSRNVCFENNTVIDAGRGLTQLIDATSTAQVQGLDSGILVHRSPADQSK